MMAWALTIILAFSLVNVPMKQVQAANPADIGTTSPSVTAVLTLNTDPSWEYHEYFLQVHNGLSQSISDWIVAIPITGVTKVEDWTSWSNVQAVYTNNYVYVYPTKSSVISANSSFGSTTNDDFKFCYYASQNASNPIVYYKTGNSPTGAFNDVISGGAGGDPPPGGGDSTTDLNLNIEYNYAKLLQYSLYFYDANMCGPQVNANCSLTWRGNCHANDRTAVQYSGRTIDISGGFHDAGDHDKFGLPQGYTASILGIGYYEYKDAFVETGQSDHFKKIMDHFCDYFVRCTVYNGSGNVEAFCYQVGDGASHSQWKAPEVENIPRPGYFATSSTPATDQVSAAISALAIHYVNFGNTEYLDCAKKLFAFAKANSKAKQNSQGGEFYNSSAWQDEYCLAAAWLFKATNDQQYKTEYNAYKGQCNMYSWPSWDDVSAYALAYGEDNWNALNQNAQSIRNACVNVDNGYSWLSKWGSARYNCNTQLEGLIYDKRNGSNSHTTWAEGQMKFLMGNNTNKRCFIVGYNENSSKYPHHRASSGYPGFPDQGYATTTQAYSLIGALVGGIEASNGDYHDNANDYYCNEVAIDYNAAFVGAAAALYLKNKNDGKQNIATAGTPGVPTGIKTFYSPSGGPSTVAVTGVTLNKPTASLTVGGTETLTPMIAPSNATNKSVTWNSNNTTVATVSSSGVVTAVKSGTATITVKTEDGNRTATCTVTVAKATQAAPQVTMNMLARTKNSIMVSAELNSGSGTLEYSISSNGSTWSTWQTPQITGSYEFTGLNAFTQYTIRVRLAETAQYVASDPALNTLSLYTLVDNPYVIDVSMLNDTEYVAALCTYDNVMGTHQTVDYDSGTKVLTLLDDDTVNSDGYTITGTHKEVTVEAEEDMTIHLKNADIKDLHVNGNPIGLWAVTYLDMEGTEIEEFEVSNGGEIILPIIDVPYRYRDPVWEDNENNIYSSESKVTISKDTVFRIKATKILVSKITLDSTEEILEVDDSVSLVETIAPEDAFDNSVTWSSSNSKIATVDEDGEVEGIAPGVVTIKATANDGSGKFAICKITVVEEEEDIEVEKIKITGITKKMAPGKKLALKAEVLPKNATDQSVEWKVNNTKYASVNKKGIVTTKKAGVGKKVTVTAIAEDGSGVKATYQISIMNNAVKKVKLSTTKKILKKGQSVTIKPKFTPAVGISKELTWTSNKPKVATVSAKGKVTAKSKGTVKITAKAKDGTGKKHTITIKVK